MKRIQIYIIHFIFKRTSGINRRLRHILNVKDDFDATRKALIVWLSDVSMRLSNLEYLRDTSPALRMQNIQVLVIFVMVSDDFAYRVIVYSNDSPIRLL